MLDTDMEEGSMEGVTELKPTLVAVLYGEPGAGKSWLAASAPAPRLILDAEGRAKYTPGKKVAWDPTTTPKFPKDVETVVVPVKNFDTVRFAYQWLLSGKHPFRSLVVDSLMEVQKKVIDGIAGQEQMRMQDWGELLRKLEGLVRSSRDIAQEEGNPLSTVVFVCGTTDLSASGVRRPLLQGQLALTLPYYVDVVGYLKAERTAAEDGTLYMQRKLLVDSYEGFATKDNTSAIVTKYGSVIPVANGESITMADLYQAVVEYLKG
jgi:hypothetical protein